MFGLGSAKLWVPVERLLFVIGLGALAATIVVTCAREFFTNTAWYEVIQEQREFVRPLPSSIELDHVAKQLAPTSKRFSYQEPIADIFGGTEGYRKYVGFYDPNCQRPLDEKEAE